MFVGRSSELKQLTKLYEQNKFQFVVVYGRRRVGKTYLLTKFIEDKKSIYFAAEQFSEKLLLEKFSDAITMAFPSSIVSQFESFEKAILYLSEKAKDEPIIVIIDEFQYWAEQNRGILSALQNLIDHFLQGTKLFLMICGSYISFMEGEVLGYKSPLYGRRTAQFKVEEFDYKDSGLMLPGYDPEQEVSAFAVLGGIPMYLKQFDSGRSLKENIIEKILNRSSFLYNEPIFALKQEFKQPAVYLSVIESVATGAAKYNEISTKCGEDAGAYLHSLAQLGIIKKEMPFGSKPNSRKAIYQLKDNYFRFWFRFVSRHMSLIEQEKYDIVYDQIIEPRLPEYTGHIFEEVCIQFLKRINGATFDNGGGTGSKNNTTCNKQLPFIFHNIGRWWGSDPKNKCSAEIDIIAADDQGNVLFGECKWRNELLGKDIILDLIAKSHLLPAQSRYYVFFSKSGFAKESKEFAKTRKDIILFTLDEIFV